MPFLHTPFTILAIETPEGPPHCE